MSFAAETVTDEWAVNERETGAGRPALVFIKAQTTSLVIFSGQGPIKSAACWDVGSRMCLHRGSVHAAGGAQPAAADRQWLDGDLRVPVRRRRRLRYQARVRDGADQIGLSGL